MSPSAVHSRQFDDDSQARRVAAPQPALDGRGALPPLALPVADADAATKEVRVQRVGWATRVGRRRPVVVGLHTGGPWIARVATGKSNPVWKRRIRAGGLYDRLPLRMSRQSPGARCRTVAQIELPVSQLGGAMFAAAQSVGPIQLAFLSRMRPVTVLFNPTILKEEAACPQFTRAAHAPSKTARDRRTHR